MPAWQIFCDDYIPVKAQVSISQQGEEMLVINALFSLLIYQ